MIGTKIDFIVMNIPYFKNFYFFIIIKASNQVLFKITDLCGATSQIRTEDPRITSAVLWPTELKWHSW